MVTPLRELAKAFAHKPTLLSISDGGKRARHNGTEPGFLYVVAEDLAPADLVPLPGTDETHWEIQRHVRVALVQELPVSDPPQLTDEETAALRREQALAGVETGFLSRRE
jgi:hypothetical protein